MGSPYLQDDLRRVLGLTLRDLRTSAGLSLRELGRRVHYDYSRLSRAENGEHLIPAEQIVLIDHTLGAGGLLNRLRALAGDSAAARAAGIAPAGLRAEAGDTVKLTWRTPDGRTVTVHVSRRQFTQLLATGTLGALLPAGAANLDEADRLTWALDAPGRLDPHVLGYFHRLLSEHFTADKMLGPYALIGQVLPQLRVLDGLRRHARPRTAAPALHLLAHYAEFAGWLYQDAGDTTQATWWSDRAGHYAYAAGDHEMVAYLLIRKSNIALMDDDAITAIELAAAAAHTPGETSPKLTALAHQQEARGWALLGEATPSRRSLDTATTLLADHPGGVSDTAPIYLHHYNLDTLATQSASCLRACGHTDTAAQILEHKIATTPEHLRRDRAHLSVKLANTLLASPHPDPERAAQLGIDSAATSHSTGSARIRKELTTLDHTLTTRWPDLPATLTLHETLAQ